jgi:hypothetical protein
MRSTFDGPLALKRESELDEELSRGCEVVNHDADVLHPLDSHVWSVRRAPSFQTARVSPNKISWTSGGQPSRLIPAAPAVRGRGLPGFQGFCLDRRSRERPRDELHADGDCVLMPVSPCHSLASRRLAEQQKALEQGFFYGRYWARTSDPQLVDLVEAFASVR